MRRQSERGQVLILFALGLVVLLGAAAFTVDLGRQSAERRYLQNAADAGALAACTSLVKHPGDTALAVSAARTVATTNLDASPAGNGAPTIADPAEYTDSDGDLTLEANEMTSGIVADTTSARVAISTSIDTTVGHILGVDHLDAVAHARCKLVQPHLVPLVARRYANAPGPNDSCPSTDSAAFVDHFATAATSTCGNVDASSVTGYDTRTPASESSPGPEFALFGPQAKASNDSQYRGFIALDIRNFRDTYSRVYYNGVTSGTNPNSISTTCTPACNGQMSYFTHPYPGPGFAAITSSINYDNQIAVIDGNKSAQVPSEFDKTFDPGDEVLVALYNGTVMEIPDYTISVGSPIDLGTSASSNPVTVAATDGPTFTVSKNSSFYEAVTLSLVSDANAPDPAYDIVASATGAPAIGKVSQPTFTPNSFSPAERRGTDVAMTGIQANAVPKGVYAAWLHGDSSTTHLQRRAPVSIRIGGAQPDFAVSSEAGSSATVGGTATIPIYLTTANSGATKWNGGALTLSVDTASLPAGFGGTISFASTGGTAGSRSPSTNGNSPADTMSIVTSGLAAGQYTVDLRVHGTNSSGWPVTHVVPVTFTVASQPSGGRYVDVIGFGVVKITSIGSNDIYATAVSPAYSSLDDEALNQFKQPRLVPWCYETTAPCSEG
jgi:hypothetical protein